MARHIIAANVRGFRFALRADWSDPDSEIEIDASASVDAPDGMEWQETGETVSYYPRHENPIDTARSALAATVQAFYDDWRATDLTNDAILAAAVLEEDA